MKTTSRFDEIPPLVAFFETREDGEAVPSDGPLLFNKGDFERAENGWVLKESVRKKYHIFYEASFNKLEGVG